MIVNPHAASVVRLARVTGVNPEGQKLEVIFLDTGDYGRDVQVLSPYAGTDFGFTSGIPAPEEEGHDPNMEPNEPGKRHIIAAVASVQGVHLCLGFMFPQITQMAFPKSTHPNRLIERHTSDFYRTVSDKGDMDMVHPGGAFMRIGSGTEFESLCKCDYDKQFVIKHNKSSNPSITLSTSEGGVGGAKVTLHANGDIVVTAAGKVTVTAEGDIAMKSGGTISMEAAGNVTSAAGGNVTSTAGGTVSMSAAANVISTAGDTVRHEAPVVYEVTPEHITTGKHTDMNGKHCWTCG